MKRITKFIALVVALLVFLTGCQATMTDTSWAFELEGERLPAGVYILFMNDAFMRATDIMVDEWMAWEEEYEGQERPPSVFDMTPDEIFDAKVEGMRVYDWVLAEAQDLTRQHLAVKSMLTQFGIEPDSELLADTLASARNDYRTHEQFFRAIGVAESSLAMTYRAAADQIALFRGLYEEGGPFEIPQSELNAYFDENFLRGQELIFFKEMPTFTGEETDEELAEAIAANEEANEELRELAQEFLERLEGGEAFEQLQYERDLMFSPNPELVDRQAPGVLDFLARRDVQFFNPAVLEGLGTLSTGEAAIFEDDWVIAVVRRLDTFADQAALDQHLDMLLWTMRFEDHFIPLIEETARTLPLFVNTAAINRYSPRILMG